MKLSDRASIQPGPWTSLWIVALISLLAQLAFCQFFTFGERVPVSLDVDPSNLWKLAYHFPPTGEFHILNWLGQAYLPQNLQPYSIAAANLSPWLFFTIYAPLMATCALLAMAAFLRELELPRPAALFGAVIYAWQGDILPFVYPGHYAYMTEWPFFALAAWGALRCERTGHWAYAVISGASCGIMVGLPTNADRGGIACLLIAALFLASIFRRKAAPETLRDYVKLCLPVVLCVALAGVIALAPLLALFKGNIEGVTFTGTVDRQQTYDFATQFSLAPVESLTYFVPGFFGWHSNNHEGPYWGWIGEWPEWPKNHQGTRNLNLAITTTGTVATVLALFGAALLLWEGLLGASRMTERQRFFGRLLLVIGSIALVLAWGWHTPFYRPFFALPLMDKWRNPLKWIELTNFALVVLSALGMQHLLASLGPESDEVKIVRRRLARFTLLLAILFGLGLAFSYPLSLVLSVVLQREDFDPPSLAAIASTMHAAALGAFLEVVLFCVVLRCLWRPEILRRWKPVNPLVQRGWQLMLLPENVPLTLALTLAGLAAVQLGWVADQFIQPIPIKDLTETNPLLEALRGEGDTVRCSVAAQDPVLNDLLQNQFAAMNISCVDISAASRIPDDLNAFFTALDSEQAQLWFLTGVKNVVVPEAGLDQMKQDAGVAANIDHAVGYTLGPTPSPDVPSHAMVTMKQYLNKATLVPDAEFLPSDDAVLKRLADLKWNPWQTILLNKSDPKPPQLPHPPVERFQKSTPGPDQVGLKVYTPEEIEIDVRSAHGGYVLVNDQYDPDWQAQVDGEPVEILRADYIMRAVRVPSGDSKVTMKFIAHYQLAGFKPSARAINNLSDAAMLASWLAAAFALRRQRSRAPEGVATDPQPLSIR